MEKKQILVRVKNILPLIAGIIVFYFLLNTLVDNRFKELELNTRVQITDQEKTLIAIAETTARNGADVVTEAIVKDCSLAERNEFDELLSNLDKGLNHDQLIKLERLFGRCGGFFAERKSIMVSRLSREIEIYSNYVDQLSIITNEEQKEIFKVEKWQSLASEEKKQSELFAKLVLLQDKIITSLVEGKNLASPEMTSILHEVKEVNETLVVTNMQVTTLRNELVAL